MAPERRASGSFLSGHPEACVTHWRKRNGPSSLPATRALGRSGAPAIGHLAVKYINPNAWGAALCSRSTAPAILHFRERACGFQVLQDERGSSGQRVGKPATMAPARGWPVATRGCCNVGKGKVGSHRHRISARRRCPAVRLYFFSTFRLENAVWHAALPFAQARCNKPSDDATATTSEDRKM